MLSPFVKWCSGVLKLPGRCLSHHGHLMLLDSFYNLCFGKSLKQNFSTYRLHAEHAYPLKNSESATFLLNYYRYAYLFMMYFLTPQNQQEAIRFLKKMERKFPETILHFLQPLRSFIKALKLRWIIRMPIYTFEWVFSNNRSYHFSQDAMKPK